MMAVTDSILLVEPVRRGAAHQAFNASLLLTCHAAFPTFRIIVAAFPDHLAFLRAALGDPDWLHYEALPESCSNPSGGGCGR